MCGIFHRHKGFNSLYLVMEKTYIFSETYKTKSFNNYQDALEYFNYQAKHFPKRSKSLFELDENGTGILLILHARPYTKSYNKVRLPNGEYECQSIDNG